MSSRAASPRIPVLAAVVAAHAGALLVLLAETRTRDVRGESEASPLLVMLFEPRERPAAAARAGRAPRPSPSRHRPRAAAEVEVPAPPLPGAPGTAIDWTAEATAAAERETEGAERRARQAQALAPKPNPMFAARPKRHEFGWNYAATHRVEAGRGGITFIHIGDNCGIALYLLIPMSFGCAVGKPAVRGDLFEHMHDPDPAPER
jgi:hypothetical protein